MKDSVRIVLVGNPGVGKSSLIATLLADAFPDRVDDVLQEVTLPPAVSYDNVTIHIVDTSGAPADIDATRQSIRRADVVCVVYAVDDSASLIRATEFWLPEVESMGGVKPVLLVGNKIDTRGPSLDNENLMEEMRPIMDKFNAIESCLECSAKNLLNISDVFFYAQKAVLNPISPLYDSQTYRLKPKCETALRRIFILLDTDKDGVLNDQELADFQQNCFGDTVMSDDLATIKGVVQARDAAAVTDAGMTELGFLLLNRLFVQHMRPETTWTMLRNFGYNDELDLEEEFLQPKMDVQPSDTVELSPVAVDFLSHLFAAFDKDRDGALSDAEHTALFSTSPGIPWDASLSATTNAQGHVELEGFLALWRMLVCLDYRKALRYFAYVGFPKNTRDCLKVIKNGRLDARTSRRTFNCYLFSRKGAGKSSLVRRLLASDKMEAKPLSPTTSRSHAVYVEATDDGDRDLVVTEFPDDAEGDWSRAVQLPTEASKAEDDGMRNVMPTQGLDTCDLVVLAYDVSDVQSLVTILNFFDFSLEYFLKHGTRVMFLGMKADLPGTATQAAMQEFCVAHAQISPPVLVSALAGVGEEFGAGAFVHEALSIAENPLLGLMESDDEGEESRALEKGLKLLVYVCGFAATAVLLRNYYSKKR